MRHEANKWICPPRINPPSHRWRVIVAALGLLLLLGMSGIAARADDAPGLSAEVKAGFQGNYRNAEWFGVLVTLKNDGDADYSGTLTLVGRSGLRAASRDVALAGHSRKQVWLYAVSGSYNGSIQLVLQQGGNTLLQRDISLSFNDQSSFLLAVVSSDGGALNVLSGTPLGNQNTGNQGSNNNSRTTVAHIGLDELPPSAAALDSLDALAITDADTSQLSEAQRAAIRAWVVGGGDLVIGGGLNGVANAAAFADILPVTVGTAQPLDDLSPLTRVLTNTEPIALSGQTVASAATIRPAARALATSANGNVLLAQRDYGRGRVSYLGVDPNLAALRAWSGYPTLWQTLFAAHYGGPSFSSTSLNSYGYGLSLLPQLDLPAPALLFIVLLVYILVVGPLNYLLLRQLGRRELAWLTTPLITVLFAAIFYAIGYQSKGGDVLVSRTAAVFASGQGDDATVVGTLGIFSPGRTSYTVQLSDTALAIDTPSSNFNSSSADAAAQLQLGNPNTVTGLNIAPWSQRAVEVADTIKLPPQFSATATGSGANLKVTLKNVSTQVYSDVVLYAPSAQYASASFQLAPSLSKEVALNRKYNNIEQLTSYLGSNAMSGGSGYYYSGGRVFYMGSNRGTVSAAERQQQAHDDLINTLINSREMGLGVSSGQYGYNNPTNNSLTPSNDLQIYIVTWSDHDYLPVSLTVGAQEPFNVTMYVAPVATLRLSG